MRDDTEGGESRGYLSSLLTAIIHSGFWIMFVFILLAVVHEAFGSESHVFFYVMLSGFAWSFMFALVAVFGLILRPIASAIMPGTGNGTGEILIVAKDLRIPVAEPERIVRRLLELTAEDPRSTTEVDGWVLVVHPIFPKLREPLWVSMWMERFSGARHERIESEHPYYFEGGMAMRAEEGAVRVVLFSPHRHQPVIGKASELLRGTSVRGELTRLSWRVNYLVRPLFWQKLMKDGENRESIDPDAALGIPDGFLDDRGVPEDLGRVWDVARRLLSYRFFRIRMHPADVMHLIAMMAYTSVITGLSVMLLAVPDLAYGVGVGFTMAFVPLIARQAYRHFFVTRVRWHTVFGRAFLENPVPRMGALVLVITYAALVTAVAVMIVILSLLTRTLSEHDVTVGFVLSLFCLIPALAAIALYVGSIIAGREVDSYLAETGGRRPPQW